MITANINVISLYTDGCLTPWHPENCQWTRLHSNPGHSILQIQRDERYTNVSTLPERTLAFFDLLNRVRCNLVANTPGDLTGVGRLEFKSHRIVWPSPRSSD